MQLRNLQQLAVYSKDWVETHSLTCCFDFVAILKGQFTPKLHLFPVTCSKISSYRLFGCEVLSFGAIGGGDVCSLLNVQ